MNENAYFDPDAAFDEMAFEDLRKLHYVDQARIADLERELESARSLAVDRDQRLAAADEHLIEAWRETTHGLTMNPAWVNQRVWNALQILRGRVAP